MDLNTVNYTIPDNRQLLRDRLVKVIKESDLTIDQICKKISINRITLGGFMVNGRGTQWKTCVKIEKFCIEMENKKDKT